MAKVKSHKKHKGGPPKAVLVLILLALVAVTVIVLPPLFRGGKTGGSSHVDVGDVGEDPSALSLFFSCDMQGRLVPYACEEGTLGGVARMETIYQEWNKKRPQRIIVDIGNSTVIGHEYADTINGFTFSAFDKLGLYRVAGSDRAEEVAYDVANCGENEASLSLDDLRKLAKDRKFKLISANLVRVDTGAPVLPTYHIVKRRERRVAFIGILAGDITPKRPGKGLRLIDPEPALKSSVNMVKGSADVIVVLAFVPPGEIHELARRFPEVHVFLGGLTPATSAPYELGGPPADPRSYIAYLGDQGCSVGRLDVSFPQGKPPQARGRVALLGEDVEAAPSFAGLVAELTGSLSGKALPGAKQDRTLPCTSSHVGSDVCKLCHIKKYYDWMKTKHAGAYVTLLQKGNQKDPACLPCHVTGYLMPGGFDPARGTEAAKGKDEASLLAASDVGDWQALCTKLKAQATAKTPSPFTRLWGLLPQETQAAIEEAAAGKPPDEPRQAKLLEGLNAAIKRADFYREQDFQRFAIPPQAQELLKHEQARMDPDATQRLNRILLETAFGPDLIKPQAAMPSAPGKAPKTQDPVKGVGCECCHGGSRHHLGIALKDTVATANTPLLRGKASARNCLRCHTADRPCRDPKARDPYDRVDYLERIKHWD
jgi:hypothetical protein